MTNKKLFEVLTLVNNVRSNNYNDVKRIVELIPSIEVKEKKWKEKYKQDNPESYPLDLSRIETWGTYSDECINLVFSNDNDKVVCEVSIYNCEEDLRFTATLIMPDNFIKELEQKILCAFDEFAKNSYEDYLETQKKIWIANFKSEILG